MTDTASIPDPVRKDVAFASGAERCAAWHYPAPGGSDRTCIVMAHGFGACRHYGLEAYAERFQARGHAVLVFDYRHFGDSEGTPRGLLSVRRQQGDWSAAVACARSLGYRRIVLWGTSFAGGHVLHTAARTAGIAAVISQVPHVSGPASAGAVPCGLRVRLTLRGLADATLGRLGRRIFVPAFGPVGTLAAMSTPGAYDSMQKLLPSDPAGRNGTSWQAYFARHNRVTASALLQVATYSPGRAVARIRCPVLLQAARRDQTTPFGPVQRASERIADCQLIAYDVDHFDVYLPPHFETTIGDQLRFLDRVLGLTDDDSEATTGEAR